MADDKELQIRLQFLDEAQEYLDIMDSRLIGIAQGFDGETINDALRAAHSVKGGAALMGFEALSSLAHRLEDGLKVLKVQRGKVEVDESLETKLLAAVDRMGQVMQFARQDFDRGERLPLPIDENWLAQDVYPIFDELHERLGEPEEEDAHSMLTPEDGQDIIPLLFQSEVEGCLQRLEEALAADSACLKEEVQILAQELSGLGEMLQLPAFTRLCQTIGAQIDAIADVPLRPTVQAALDTWRTVQAQVISGNYNDIPETFTGSPEHPLEPLSEEQITATFATAWPQAEPAVALDSTAPPSSETDFDLTDVVHQPVENGLAAATGVEDFNDFDDFYVETQPEAVAANGQTAADDQPAEAPSEATTDSESTVRVPVKQINQLSDLFGELVIERNRLEVEVKRLRGLVSM
ncbi:MAG: Hpt domain-containing protein, partial [Cyanobacteria bacterium P01_C01_bin.70]